MSKVVVFDAITRTERIRDMTEEELAQDKIDKANATALAQAQVQLEEAKAAAEAKLAALGLTTDDLKALGLN